MLTDTSVSCHFTAELKTCAMQTSNLSSAELSLSVALFTTECLYSAGCPAVQLFQSFLCAVRSPVPCLWSQDVALVCSHFLLENGLFTYLDVLFNMRMPYDVSPLLYVHLALEAG